MLGDIQAFILVLPIVLYQQQMMLHVSVALCYVHPTYALVQTAEC